MQNAPQSPRPFTLLDVMVLIAATAAGIAWTRLIWESVSFVRLAPPEAGWDLVAVLARVPFVLDAVVLVVAAWTVALLGLRLWSPRPSMSPAESPAGVGGQRRGDARAELFHLES